MLRLPVGIGAKGFGQARLFHPSQHISEKWPNGHSKKRVLEVFLVGKGTHHVNQKDQLFYECRLPEIDRPSSTFSVATSKLKNPLQPPLKMKFLWWTVVDPHQNLERKRTMSLHESVADVAPNVGELSQEITELRHQEIEVDNDNEPAPENAQLITPATHTIGKWGTLTICPRMKYVNCHNTKGVWKQHSWPKLSEMMEISLFRISFPEKWVRDALIPETNKERSGGKLPWRSSMCIWDANSSWHALRGSLTKDCGGTQNRYHFGKDPPSGCRSTVLPMFHINTSAMRFTNKPSPSFLIGFMMCGRW